MSARWKERLGDCTWLLFTATAITLFAWFHLTIWLGVFLLLALIDVSGLTARVRWQERRRSAERLWATKEPDLAEVVAQIMAIRALVFGVSGRSDPEVECGNVVEVVTDTGHVDWDALPVRKHILTVAKDICKAAEQLQDQHREQSRAVAEFEHREGSV